MLTSTRLQFKAMLHSWLAFDNSIKLAENALDAKIVEKFAYLKHLVHENFFAFDKEFRNYKAVVIENSAKKGDIINGTIVTKQSKEIGSNHQHNDVWAQIQMTRYTDTLENLEDGLEMKQNMGENKTSLDPIELLFTVADIEFKAIESKVKQLQCEISELTNGNGDILSVSKSVLYEQIETLTYGLKVSLTEKVNDVLDCGEGQIDVKEDVLSKYEKFVVVQQDVLDNCSILLSSEVKTDEPVIIGPKLSLHDVSVKPTKDCSIDDQISSDMSLQVEPNCKHQDCMWLSKPNQCLIGSSYIDEHSKILARVSYVKKVCSALWEKWIGTLLSKLVQSNCWKNVKKEDMKHVIVLFKDSRIIQNVYLGVGVLTIFFENQFVCTAEVDVRKQLN